MEPYGRRAVLRPVSATPFCDLALAAQMDIAVLHHRLLCQPMFGAMADTRGTIHQFLPFSDALLGNSCSIDLCILPETLPSSSKRHWRRGRRTSYLAIHWVVYIRHTKPRPMDPDACRRGGFDHPLCPYPLRGRTAGVSLVGAHPGNLRTVVG